MAAPAVERPQPQDEFAQLERLGEVVVGAELEPGDLVVEPLGRGQHEDGHPAARGDDVPGDLVTRRPGDVAVEDGDVIGVDAQQFQGGVAVTRDVGGDGVQAQTVADGLRQKGFVLDDQHAHAPHATNRRISSTYRKAHTQRQRPAALTWRHASNPLGGTPPRRRPDYLDHHLLRRSGAYSFR